MDIQSIITDFNSLTGESVASESIKGEIGGALLFAVIGFIIVIAALAVLIVILLGLNKLNKIIPESGFGKKNAAKTSPTATATPTASDLSDDSVIAAITAAVAIALSSQSSEGEQIAPPFIIRSVRKINGGQL